MLIALLVLCAGLSHRQATVWRSDLTIWAHAAALAPNKPRPWTNLGAALILAQRDTEARAVLRHAESIASQPSISATDRRITLIAVSRNLQASYLRHPQVTWGVAIPGDCLCTTGETCPCR